MTSPLNFERSGYTITFAIINVLMYVCTRYEAEKVPIKLEILQNAEKVKEKPGKVQNINRNSTR